MNPNVEPLFQRLKELVNDAGTAAELARRSSIPPTTMAGYLTGKFEPRATEIRRIAMAMGVTVAWLVSGEEPKRRDEGVRGTPEKQAASSPPIITDARLIGRLTEKIMMLYKEMGMGIALHQAAELAAREHDRIVAAITDPDDRLIQIGVVLAALRQELQAKAADPASSKHRA